MAHSEMVPAATADQGQEGLAVDPPGTQAAALTLDVCAPPPLHQETPIPDSLFWESLKDTAS